MVDETKVGSRVAIVAIAPAAFLAALLSHPHIAGRLPNDVAVAEAVIAGPTRWALAHIAAGVASALLLLAFLAIHSFLREADEQRWSAVGVPFIVLGSVLYAMLPGMEFAPLAASATGADVAAAQGALGPWFLPMLLSSAVLFAVGAGAFARAIARARIGGAGTASVVAGALLVMAASRFMPFSVVQFQVQGAAGLVAFWPLAYVMWRAPRAAPAGSPRTIPV